MNEKELDQLRQTFWIKRNARRADNFPPDHYRIRRNHDTLHAKHLRSLKHSRDRMRIWPGGCVRSWQREQLGMPASEANCAKKILYQSVGGKLTAGTDGHVGEPHSEMRVRKALVIVNE